MTDQIYQRRTKIVATLGPAWSEPAQMHAMLDAGVDVVRINASHGTPETRVEWIKRLNEVIHERRARRAAAVLVDLQGPRIRVGVLATPRVLTPGERVTFAPEASAAPGEIPMTYEALAQDVRPGARILLDDGLLSVEVIDVEGPRVIGRVEFGGELRSKKGMNLPGIEVSAPAVSDRDREEVARVIGLGVDFVAVSFVRRAEDMHEVRRLVPATMKLVAKIEKDTALRQLPAILDASDAIMVARGDLGVELPFEEVPLAQKKLIRAASTWGKPVITATQMLESMVQNPRPTRAEASDVANAILDGTDAVMLSAETAVGAHALAAVQAMARIAHEVETHRPRTRHMLDIAGGSRTLRGHEHGHTIHAKTADAIAVAGSAAAQLLSAPCIACFTVMGTTARTVAAFRPGIPIVAVTPRTDTFRQLQLVWGVVPVLVDEMPTYEALLEAARHELLARGLAHPGDRVVVTAGVPFGEGNQTNLLRVEVI